MEDLPGVLRVPKKIMMKRVRKEIRELKEWEWHNIVDAIWVMKGLSDIDGKAIYGPKFVSYDTMVGKHIAAALDPRGDQAHFGPVLALFHRAWLLELENSVLAVDSSIEALPYWDYTRDVAPLNGNYTSIFSAKYFGSYVGEAPDYSVIDGEFGRWPILKNTDTSEHLQYTNVYGYLRHPLSLNKSPYLTRRGGSICGYNIVLGNPQMWNLCLNSGDRISDWTACVDGNIHGPAHSSIAGSWRRDGQTSDSPFCAQWFGFIAPPANAKLLNATSDTRYPFGTFINPYALNCFDCPTCDMTQNPNSCSCKPHAAKGTCGPLWTSLVNSTQATYLRGDKGNNLSSDARNSITLTDSTQIQILGDMGDPSASPNDPLFWAHHANIDRHFETWTTMHSSETLTSNYYNFPKSKFAPGCNLNDVINSRNPFRNLGEDGTSHNDPYTIKDIFDLFTGDNTPYTYDSIVIAKTQRRTPSILNPFSTGSAEISSLTESLSDLIKSKNSTHDVSMHSDEFNRILKSSKYYSSNSFVKCQSSPTIIEEGMPASVCDHTIALGNLLRGEYLERSGVFSITFDHDTFNIIGAVSLITVVAIARYVLNRLMYVPYKAQLQKRGGDSGVNLIVAITKEMRQVNMESNIVSPSPQEHIVSRTPDDEFAVLDNMNEISDHTISSRDSMNDIVTRSNSSDGNTVASSINSSCYSDRGGLRCRTPLSSGEVAVIHERRKS